VAEIALVTDSTSDLPREWAAERHVHVVPLYVRFGDEVLRDGVDLDPKEFYRRLRSAKELPRTSQPAVGDFVELYRRLLESAEAVLSVHISRGLSGTIAAAEAAKQQLAAGSGVEPPIHIIDTRAASAGSALVVSAAADGIAAGLTAAALVTRLEQIVARMFTAFTVDTLEYLHKNGRIGTASALLGSVLQVRPILYFRDGLVAVREKPRTSARARERIIELSVAAAGGRPVRAAVCHADAAEAAEEARRQLTEKLDCREALVVQLGPVVGSHGGPGTLGVACYSVE